MSVDAPAVPPRARPSRPMPRRFLPEVQGLRAVAVLLVLVYHLNAAVLPAASSASTSSSSSPASSSPPSCCARSTPAAGSRSPASTPAGPGACCPRPPLVLLATAIATVLLLSRCTRWSSPRTRSRQRRLRRELACCAAQTVGLPRADDAPSPVQHFWSLAVEEQFYLVWPLLFAGRRRCARRAAERRGAPRRWSRGAIAVDRRSPRLISGHDDTPTRPPPTSSPPRGCGSSAPAGCSRWPRAGWRRRPALRAVLAGPGWSRSSALAAVYYSEPPPFPGYAALLPVLGAAAVIAAGARGAAAAPGGC